MAENIVDAFRAPSWGTEDAEALQTFLKSKTGKRFIHRLRSDRPSHPSGSSKHSLSARAMSDAVMDGYDGAIFNMFRYLTASVEETDRSDNFPSIDDDSMWSEELREISRPILVDPDAPVIPKTAEKPLVIPKTIPVIRKKKTPPVSKT